MKPERRSELFDMIGDAMIKLDALEAVRGVPRPDRGYFVHIGACPDLGVPTVYFFLPDGMPCTAAMMSREALVVHLGKRRESGVRAWMKAGPPGKHGVRRGDFSPLFLVWPDNTTMQMWTAAPRPEDRPS